MGSASADESMPWYLKTIIALAILVVAGVLVIDLLTFIGAL